MSFLQRLTQDASNACSDFYSNWVLGDDAGKSARLTLILHPKALPVRNSHSRPGTARIDLGMTFLEINGRAYVKSVAAGSPAADAGVLPQDAVQYACVFKEEWMDHPSQHEQSNQQQHRHQQEFSMSVADSLLGGDEAVGDSFATRFALGLEHKGMRISYDELRNLLAEAMDPTQAAFLSPALSSRIRNGALTPWRGPPAIPSTVNICGPMESSHHNTYPDDEYVDLNHRPNSPFRGEMPRPVVFVFRRTRQRKALHHIGMPSFRLDDECDFASSLVKRLAPTADMEIPPPDTWEELVHDGTDWLLGNGSILPPKNQRSTAAGANSPNDDDQAIPLDAFERERAKKLANLRSRMAAEAMRNDWTDDVEAATVRGMIQKAVGLAFVRASKIVLGVSIHGGTGIVMARLSDGTWSAPSAIGTWGLGLGVQFGLEVAEYIFILQTQEALDHFRRSGSFTVGGNIGAAVAGLGREAYGAASVGGVCGATSTVKDDEYNDTNSRDDNHAPQSLAIAPIVAYAKSQGLYIGVSLEGSRIFSRDDINSRTYKFSAGRDVTAFDVLSGKVPSPPEAEELYAALHSVEFTHEMSCLPRPPEILRKDSANGWFYDRSTLSEPSQDGSPQQPFSFITNLSETEFEECETFETQFKKFMYGGVSVQRLLPDTEGRFGRTSKERRTLWLMLPEVGSLRLGFVSKLSDGDGAISNKSSTQRASQDDPSRLSGFDGDVGTVGSEEVTLDSAINTKEGGSTIGHIRTGNVQLSTKHSLALTDVTVLSQDPRVQIRFKEEDKMEHLRVISVQDENGLSLLFLANNFREAELLVCGLKLLLERETTRLGVRGGLPVTAFGGRTLASAMSPSAARGFRDTVSTPKKNKKRSSRSGYASSDVGEDDSPSEDNDAMDPNLPEGRSKWGNVPGRNYMRVQAAALTENNGNGVGETGVPRYAHGQSIDKDIARNVRLPLPLPLCRVLLLDSTSPVIKSWEKDRGDKLFEKTRWAFPPATPRELERHASEHQLIASGSMYGAHRTTSFERPRYGSLVRLSETHTVDADDSKKLTFTVTERNPRRGFSIKVRVMLRAHKANSCEATAVAEIRPVGKDMSNQAAVHNAFLLVLDEVKERYGMEDSGLMAGFLSVVDNMGNGGSTLADGSSKIRLFPRTGPATEEKKTEHPPPATAKKSSQKSGLISFEDMLKTGRQSPESRPMDRRPTPSFMQPVPESDPERRLSGRASAMTESNEFLAEEKQLPIVSDKKDNVLIEVKPLAKIRLSLMPSPREEDEEGSSVASPVPVKPVKKKGSSRKKLVNSPSWRKSLSRRIKK